MALGRAVALAATILALSPGPAWAIPPPMSTEELERLSDVIARVRVLAVACTGVVVESLTRGSFAPSRRGSRCSNPGRARWRRRRSS